ncbi:MAG: hypothetical protein M5U05_01155 [Anaerolineales bacterium]|jgi:hypothetical protein|nr:hypothetical protein [Anaerolineales bacterium]
MDEQNATSFMVAFFLVLRCLVPLLIMLGVSFILKKIGLIREPPKRPPDRSKDNSEHQNGNGGFAHA